MVTMNILKKAKEHANLCCNKNTEHWMEDFLDSILQYESMDRDDAWNLVSEVGLPKFNQGTYAIAYRSSSILEPIQVCTTQLSYWVDPEDKKSEDDCARFECWDKPDMRPDLYKSGFPIKEADVIAWKLLEPPRIKGINA